MEQNETFSLTVTIQNRNGQSVEFSTGGDNASATITDDDGQLLILCVCCCVCLFVLFCYPGAVTTRVANEGLGKQTKLICRPTFCETYNRREL